MDQSSELSRVTALVDQANRLAPAGALPVGILTPLTPPGDPVAGELCVRGAVLGARYAAEHGLAQGVRLALANDQAGAADENMARTAVGGLAKLAFLDRVSAVVGQWHLRTSLAVADTAEEIGLPVFIENGHNTVNAGRRHVYRTYFSIADRAPLIAAFAREQGWRKIALVAAGTVFGQMLADTLERSAAEMIEGAEVLRIDFAQEGVTDLDEPLRRAAAFGPDLLLNAAVVRTNYMVIAAAASAGLLPGVPMIACFPFPMRSRDYWRLAGEAGAGVIWPSTRFSPGWPGMTPAGQWFVERYETEFGGSPPDNTLNAFTDVVILAQASAMAGSTGRAALQRALETGTFDTWRGPVSFPWSQEAGHHDCPEIVLMHYRNAGDSVQDAVVVWPPHSATGAYTSPVAGQAAKS